MKKIRINNASLFSQSVRNNALRLELVDAIITSSECIGISFCTSPDCCLYLGRLASRIGLATIKNVEDDDSSDRCLEFSDNRLVSEIAKEALAALSFQHEVGRYADEWTAYDLLIEIPQIPASIWDYFENQAQELQRKDIPKSWQIALKRQIAFFLVSLALPDSYLDNFSLNTNHENNSTDQVNLQTNWEKWVEVFNSINMPILDLPNSITDSISTEGPWSEEFFGDHGCWHEAAGYDIEAGGKSEFVDLKEYVDRFPSLPGFFNWYDRGNGYNSFGGFLVRGDGILVSQTWTFNQDNNDFYVRNFNDHLAPMLNAQPESHFDHVIVVHSDFIDYAYLASSDPRSWMPETPEIRLRGQLPDGYGWVSTFDRNSEYVPGCLSLFQSDVYSPRLRAAARYLANCLNHQGRIGVKER